MKAVFWCGIVSIAIVLLSMQWNRSTTTKQKTKSQRHTAPPPQQHHFLYPIQKGDYFLQSQWKIIDFHNISTLPSYKNIATLELRHAKYNTSLFYVYNPSDSHNFMSISFKTPPIDNSGLTHVLEHVVLSGGEKFGVRDPFYKMDSRSLNTYNNAWTVADHTCFSFASLNENDFFNLLQVYWDSIFQSRLHYFDFLQEGIRTEIDKQNQIIYKGIVFNEMKGILSEASTFMQYEVLKHLYNGTFYQFNFGGNVLEMKQQLQYTRLKQYYSQFYHPSKSLLFYYGNIPIETVLTVIESQLAQLNSVSAPTNFFSILPEMVSKTQQQQMEQEIILYGPMDSLKNEAQSQTSFLSAYLVNTIEELYDSFLLEIIEQLLIGNPRGVLYKDLIASELATDFVSFAGYDQDDSTRKQRHFIIGVTGMEAKEVNKVKQQIRKSLYNCVKNGFSQQDIQAALHHLQLERKKPSSNYGFHFSVGVMPLWIHGVNPVNYFTPEKQLQRFETELKHGQTCLTSRIEKYFLSNSVIHIMEQPTNTSILVEEIKFSQEEIEMAKNTTQLFEQHVKNIQSKEQDYESKLPILNLETDILNWISNGNRSHIFNRSVLSNVKIFENEQHTNGLVFLTLYTEIPFHLLPFDLIRLIPIYTKVITQLGAGKYNQKKLSEQIELVSSGFTVETFVSESNYSAKYGLQNAGITWEVYCLEENLPKLLELWKEILSYPHLHKIKLLQQLVDQHILVTEDITEEGSEYAEKYAAQNITCRMHLEEVFSGITSMETITAASDEDNAMELHKQLRLIHSQLFQEGKLLVTCDSSCLEEHSQVLDEFVTHVFAPALQSPHKNQFHYNVCEEIMEELQQNSSNMYKYELDVSVKFVAQVFHTASFDENLKDYSLLKLLSYILFPYLHTEIREKGGAYGARSYIESDGTFKLSSYRDPDVNSTLHAFDHVIQTVCSGNFRRNGPIELREAKFKAFQMIDAPLNPHSKAFGIFLYDYTDEKKQQYRNLILHATLDEVLEACNKYLKTTNKTNALLG